MRDFLDQEIKVGDIVAHAQRTSDRAYLSLKLVTETRIHEEYGRKTEQVKVIGFTHVDREWNGDKWVDVPSHFEMNSRGGYTEPDRLVVVTDKAPYDVREFLNETR